MDGSWISFSYINKCPGPVASCYGQLLMLTNASSHSKKIKTLYLCLPALAITGLTMTPLGNRLSYDLRLSAETSPDEMESLYNCLKSAHLSLIGRSSQRDFRASFIRRCHNDQVNDKFHLLRILSSTLKVSQRINCLILQTKSVWHKIQKSWKLNEWLKTGNTRYKGSRVSFGLLGHKSCDFGQSDSG